MDGFMQQPSTTGEHCVTCANEARPARVLRVDPAARLALVALNDVEGEVDISRLDDVKVGQTVLISDGVAVSLLQV
jgi:hydrogenase maturation factor